MTYDQLADAISKMTPNQKKRPAVIAMQQTGEVAEIESLGKIEDFNGTELPEQMVIWYENQKDPDIF
jgi:hypothetical protein